MDKKKGPIMSLLNNRWFVRIIIIIISGVVSLVVLYFWEYRTTQITRTDLMSRVNNADQLLKSDEVDDALLKYEGVLREVSEARYPDIYAHIKNSQGMCYGKLAQIVDKEENLKKAIRAFEEALKIYTIEKHPLYYEGVASNISRVKQQMKAEHQ